MKINRLYVKIMDKTQFEKYKKLGLNIAYYRKEKGYTQMELSEILGIDRTHMGRIESANVGVSLDIIFKLCDVLQIPVNKLFEFRD